MKQLWAPWRVTYITNTPPKEGCIFCGANESDDDRNRLVLVRQKHSLIMLNRYPYTAGHLMVMPRRHIAEIGLLKDLELLDLMHGVQQATALLREVAQPDGYNIGINQGKTSGAGIEEHLHVHVVPRWNGDTNFMSVVDDVRVIPEGLLESYDRLMKAVRKGGE
ncbi:MAG TPA: HIT domain-containing protein [Desulfuromonadaceae bacterium]|jgi:ATP adenylyltransferase